MALSRSAVKQQIRDILDAGMSNTDPEGSRDAYADAMADIICQAAKAAVEAALYDVGLSAPNGPVTGDINLTVEIQP